jgi:phosphoenolpyruvate carboxykinase (ATP)
VNGVDDSILNPQNSWTDKAAYAASAKQLAESFIKNFNNFTETEEGKKLVPFGPVVE